MTRRPKSERIRFGKDVRIAVHAKCHGHCAYCGCKVTMQEMQIDHIVALHNGGDNSLANLLPACRQCNFYKSTLTLEQFRRELLGTLPRRTSQLFNVRLAIKYGYYIVGNGWDGLFYFEKQQLKHKNGGKR